MKWTALLILSATLTMGAFASAQTQDTCTQAVVDLARTQAGHDFPGVSVNLAVPVQQGGQVSYGVTDVTVTAADPSETLAIYSISVDETCHAILQSTWRPH